jgi:putative sterol carrier protein
MKYWKDENEPVTAFVKLFEAAFRDESLAREIGKVNQLVWFDYTQSGPNCSFYIDSRNGNTEVKAGKPVETPDLILSLSADDGHLAWSNKLRILSAMLRNRLRVKGPTKAIRKLSPALTKISKIYAGVLTELGWEDRIIK